MGGEERVGDLGIPIFKMDRNPMEPRGEEMPTYCLSSVIIPPQKVHCFWNLIFWSHLHLFQWYEWTVSGTTFTHFWGCQGSCNTSPLTEIHRSKNSSRTATVPWNHLPKSHPQTSCWYLIVKDVRYSKMIWQEAGGTGLIQPGEEEALEEPNGNLPTCKGGHQENRAMIFTEIHSRRMWDNRHKLK